MWRRRVSVRRISVLANHLPADSAVRSTGWDDYTWTGVTQAVVDLHDQVRLAVNKTASALPRPGDAARLKSQEDRIFAKAARFERRRQQLGR